MTLFQRALGIIRRIRSTPHLAAARSTSPNDSSISLLRLYRGHTRFSSQSKHQQDLVLGVVFAGPAGFLLGSSMITANAESTSGAELLANSEQGNANVTGLQRIEDGSIVSNSHTVKWRIFTDNGRDRFLKGKLDEAEKFFQSALSEAKEGFGPRDPHVASSYNNLAELYRVRKAFEKAEPLYLEAINILEEAFGGDDIRVGAALHNLGQFYLAQRKLEQAQTYYERALKIEGRVLGYGHTEYANTMYHLGTVLHLMGKEKDAVALVQESIRILEEGGLGETATCVRRMRYLSQMLLSSNRVVEAEKVQRKALHILEISKGWNSMDTIFAAESLALTLQSLESLDEAQDLLERCLNARKKLLPHNHIQVAANLLHLGRVAMLRSNHLRKTDTSEARAELDKAKSHADDSLRIAEEFLDRASKNQENAPNGNLKEQRTALLILLQSMDFAGLLASTTHETLEPGEMEILFDVESALRKCISMFKEPGMRSLLKSADIREEYLSCLKRLVNLATENVDCGGTAERSRVLKELIDEALHVETVLSTKRHKK